MLTADVFFCLVLASLTVQSKCSKHKMLHSQGTAGGSVALNEISLVAKHCCFWFVLYFTPCDICIFLCHLIWSRLSKRKFNCFLFSCLFCCCCEWVKENCLAALFSFHYTWLSNLRGGFHFNFFGFASVAAFSFLSFHLTNNKKKQTNWRENMWWVKIMHCFFIV